MHPISQGEIFIGHGHLYLRPSAGVNADYMDSSCGALFVFIRVICVPLFLLSHRGVQGEHGDFWPAIEAELRTGGTQAAVSVKQHIVDLIKAYREFAPIHGQHNRPDFWEH